MLLLSQIDPCLFFVSVQYLIFIYRYFNTWRKNPQWSFSCCLALLLPLNELQGEVRGLGGKSFIQQQLQTGKIDMPTMTGALKDSGTINFSLDDDEKKEGEEKNDNKMKNIKATENEQSYVPITEVTIHKMTERNNDTAL